MTLPPPSRYQTVRHNVRQPRKTAQTSPWCVSLSRKIRSFFILTTFCPFFQYSSPLSAQIPAPADLRRQHQVFLLVNVCNSQRHTVEFCPSPQRLASCHHFLQFVEWIPLRKNVLGVPQVGFGLFYCQWVACYSATERMTCWLRLPALHSSEHTHTHTLKWALHLLYQHIVKESILNPNRHFPWKNKPPFLLGKADKVFVLPRVNESAAKTVKVAVQICQDLLDPWGVIPKMAIYFF